VKVQGHYSGIDADLLSEISAEELYHLAGMLLRVKLAGGGVTSIRQPPNLLGLLGRLIKVIKIRQVLVMVAVDEKDWARSNLTHPTHGFILE
jgi:hypothetical protein